MATKQTLSQQKPLSNTNPLSRRRFLTGLVGLVPLATARPSTLNKFRDESPAILPHLEAIKTSFTPFFAFFDYIEQGAFGAPVDPDTLVQLWSAATDCLKFNSEVLDLCPFEENILYPLVGKDEYRQACARNLEGYEL